jgi:hypothetical protein
LAYRQRSDGKRPKAFLGMGPVMRYVEHAVDEIDARCGKAKARNRDQNGVFLLAFARRKRT